MRRNQISSFARNGRVHLNRPGGGGVSSVDCWQPEVCASAVVMLDTPCSEGVWRVLATHCIRQFPSSIPSRASPCAVTFQLDSMSHLINIWMTKIMTDPEVSDPIPAMQTAHAQPTVWQYSVRPPVAIYHLPVLELLQMNFTHLNGDTGGYHNSCYMFPSPVVVIWLIYHLTQTVQLDTAFWHREFCCDWLRMNVLWIVWGCAVGYSSRLQ